MGNYFFTEKGIKRIREEAEKLETLIKVDIARDIGTAAAHGDLRENAEYAAAKEKQAMAITKLRELQERIRHARVVKQSDFPADTVTLFKEVHLKMVSSGKEVTYQILGEGDSDLERGIISYETPLARALIGHKKGEVVDVELPRGTEQFEILDLKFIDE